MRNSSLIRMYGPIPFPSFTGERVYMVPVYDGQLPEHLSRWQKTVDVMLKRLPTPSICYVMIDQQRLEKGEYHRRPGLHVDGYWGFNKHQKHRPKMHRGAPPRHYSTPAEPQRKEDDDGPIHRKGPTHSGGEDDWSDAQFTEPEALLLASNVQGCRAFVGKWDGEIGNGGDCSKIDTTNLKEIMLDPWYCYAGTVGTLHESLPMPYACERTIVRINIPDLQVASV